MDAEIALLERDAVRARHLMGALNDKLSLDALERYAADAERRLIAMRADRQARRAAHG